MFGVSDKLAERLRSWFEVWSCGDAYFCEGCEVICNKHAAEGCAFRCSRCNKAYRLLATPISGVHLGAYPGARVECGDRT